MGIFSTRTHCDNSYPHMKVKVLYDNRMTYSASSKEIVIFWHPSHTKTDVIDKESKDTMFTLDLFIYFIVGFPIRIYLHLFVYGIIWLYVYWIFVTVLSAANLVCNTTCLSIFWLYSGLFTVKMYDIITVINVQSDFMMK